MSYKSEKKFPELNLPKEQEKESEKKGPIARKRKIPIFFKIILGFFIILLVLGLFFSFKIASIGNNIFQSEEGNSIFSQIQHLVLAENRKIKGENEKRTNILLLGMGGEGHQGELLTDTIMIASIEYSGDGKHQVAIISIPRDMAVPLNNSQYVKINSIYAYGEMKNPDNNAAGGKMISDYINKVTGLPIHYYIRIDFEGFKQIIDSIGGIKVDVKNSFYDSRYPTENFGYQKIFFEKGLTKMDGDLALKYARSRHGIVTDGEESEGSDFARAKRQQQILTSLKDKAFSISTITNPKKINEILNALGNHVRTNLEPWEILRLSDFAKDVKNEEVISKVIDQESGLLEGTKGKNNAYLLIPLDKNYSQIKQFCLHIFNLEKIGKEREAKIAILNGTSIKGLASKNANQLLKEKYKIAYTGNAKNTDYEKTVIYDLTEGQMPDAMAELREKFKANLSLNNFSESISKNPIDNIKEIDFVVILGQDLNI